MFTQRCFQCKKEARTHATQPQHATPHNNTVVLCLIAKRQKECIESNESWNYAESGIVVYMWSRLTCATQFSSSSFAFAVRLSSMRCSGGGNVEPM